MDKQKHMMRQVHTQLIAISQTTSQDGLSHKVREVNQSNCAFYQTEEHKNHLLIL